MRLLKGFISYSVIFVLIIGQVNPANAADSAAGSNELSPAQIIEANRGMLESLSTVSVEEEEPTPRQPGRYQKYIDAKETIKDLSPSILSKMLQVAIISTLNLAQQDVKRRMNEEHLEMTTRDVQNVTDTVVSELVSKSNFWLELKSAGFNSVVSSGLTVLFQGTSKPFLRTFVSSALFSGTSLMLGDLINSSIVYTLKHPEEVGGLTDDERKALNTLLHHLGVSFFTVGLLQGSPVVKSAYGKVNGIFKQKLWSNDKFRATLMQHLEREMIFSGNFWEVMQMTAFSTFLSKKFIGMNGLKEMGFIRYNSTWAAIQVATSFGSLWFPNIVIDGETYALRGGASATLLKLQDNKDFALQYQIANRELPPPSWNQAIQKNIKERTSQRETRLDYHLSILRLALDRLNYYNTEMRHLEKQSQKSQDKRTQDLLSQIPFAMDPEVVKDYVKYNEGFSIQYAYAKGAVEYYKGMYERAAKNINGIYEHDHQQMAKTFSIVAEASLKEILKQEDQRIYKLTSYFRDFTNSLRQGINLSAANYNSAAFDPTYLSYRNLLNRAAFSRLQEANILSHITK